MALALVIGNKNYSSWSMRPWRVEGAGLAFEDVSFRFIPVRLEQRIRTRLLTIGQGPDPGR